MENMIISACCKLDDDNIHPAWREMLEVDEFDNFELESIIVVEWAEDGEAAIMVTMKKQSGYHYIVAEHDRFLHIRYEGDDCVMASAKFAYILHDNTNNW